MSGCVNNQRAIRTFCWLPTRQVLHQFLHARRLCVHAFVRFGRRFKAFALLQHAMLCKALLCGNDRVVLDRQNAKYAALTAFLRQQRQPMCLASRTDFTLERLAVLSTWPDVIARRPNKASTISVRCAPTRPPMPNISPLCSSNDTCWNDFGNGEHRSSTFSTTSFPGYLGAFGGNGSSYRALPFG